MEIDQFLQEYQKIGSDRTRKAYRLALLRFDGYLGDESLELPEIRPWHIRQFAERLGEIPNRRTGEIGVSDSTVQLHLAAISSYFLWLEQRNRVSGNPVKGLKFHRHEKPRIVQPLAPDTTTAMCRTSTDPQDVAIVTLFRRSGLRLAELAGLDRDTIEVVYEGRKIKGASITVVGKGGKQRTVPLDTDTVETIIRQLKRRGRDGERALFVSNRGRRISMRTIQRHIQKMGARVGEANAHPHRLRHAYGTEMIAKKVPEGKLTNYMGHERAETLYRYVAVSDVSLMRHFDCAMEASEFAWEGQLQS